MTGCGPSPMDCDDGNPCTVDSCDPTTGGVIHTAVAIDDANACTADSCNPATGVTHVEGQGFYDGSNLIHAMP